MEDHIRFSPTDRALLLLDQRFLPVREETFACRTLDDVIYALKEMVVRGAPAIGVTAAFGAAIVAREIEGQYGAASPREQWESDLNGRMQRLADARPTAVNLAWAVDRMQRLRREAGASRPADLAALWEGEAERMRAEDVAVNRRMGENGATLLRDGDAVLTHCNAGALATAGWGTALGVIYSARAAGKNIKVIADETRPFLQGARLTAYELHKEGIPVTVACDNACGLLMRRGLVDKVIVGADRIAANGDAANKIGTYGVALLAKAHGIPFYVAAPLSTIDPNAPNGDAIPIEERTPREVTHVGDLRLTPEGVPVYNFAFDVTPAAFIAGIITEAGVLTAPYETGIARALAGARQPQTNDRQP